MTEEEKSAIEYLYMYADDMENKVYDYETTVNIKKVLKLVHKQKEEIKALELIHETYKEEIKNIEDKYISKDKIREVLEKERKKQKERTDISLALHSQYISLIDKIKNQLLEEK